MRLVGILVVAAWLSLGACGSGSSKPAADAATSGLVPLYRCRAGVDHFVSSDSMCEGQQVETTLGWVTSG